MKLLCAFTILLLAAAALAKTPGRSCSAADCAAVSCLAPDREGCECDGGIFLPANPDKCQCCSGCLKPIQEGKPCLRPCPSCKNSDILVPNCIKGTKCRPSSNGGYTCQKICDEDD